jgi:hypothetical protein
MLTASGVVRSVVMQDPAGDRCAATGSEYGTTRGGGEERWPHAPLAVPGFGRRS